MRLSLAALLATSALLAGCTSGGGGSTSASSAATADPAVAYVDKVCSAASEFATATKQPPKLDATDPAKLKADMGVYLGQIEAAFAKSATALRAVGPSPVAGGDDQVKKMADTYDQVAKVFADAKVKVDQADAADPNGGLQPAREAIAKLPQFSQPLKDLDTNPELLAASQKAPNCQAFSAPTSAAPTSPAPTSVVPTS